MTETNDKSQEPRTRRVRLPKKDTAAKLRYLLEEELITAREYERRMAELEES